MSSSKNLKENVRLTIVGERWLKMKDRRSNRQIQRLWQKRFTYKRTQRKLLLLLLPLKDEMEKDRRSEKQKDGSKRRFVVRTNLRCLASSLWHRRHNGLMNNHIERLENVNHLLKRRTIWLSSAVYLIM